ncbi:MAG: NAD(P)/FAD-dependent oxidoreductase [Thermoplasmatales archaeon]|nr:MAG: NAD(P)/FAD-dependent oxidoreductase [Thermoplasmatales archaeon]
MYDIIVVGGNLSGASAASVAAEKGAKCALIERHQKPYSPAHCGEGIPDVVGDFLKLDEIGCLTNPIEIININLSTIKEYTFKLKKHKIIIIDRNKLEKHLLEKAEQNGAELFIGKTVKDFKPPDEVLLDNNESLKGKIIIDASGIACHIGSKIGIDTKLKPEDVGVCIQSRIKGSFVRNTVKLWYHKPYAPFGYAWVFPINNTLANVGLGITGGQKLDMQELLDKYIQYETKGDCEILHTFRSCVPSAYPLIELVKDNVMFVGDSARLANSATGAGILNAIISGNLAGCIATKYLKGGINTLDTYTLEMKRILKRLKKTYNRKIKLTTDEKFLTGYKKAFSLLSFANSISPGFFQNYVAKRVEKELIKLEKYK